MALTPFEALEKQIIEHGVKQEDSIDLTELVLVNEEDDKSIGFVLFGTHFVLYPSGEIATVDEDDNGDIQSYLIGDEMREQLTRFLAWRHGFIQRFGI